MMHSSYTTRDGRTVETPLLDGVLERAMNLLGEWSKQKPELESFPGHILLFQAIARADVIRIIEGFKKAGISKKVALGYAHSHLLESLMFSGIITFLGGMTWRLEQESDDPTAPPSTFGLTQDFPSEEELRESAEFKKNLPENIGPEATEHVLQAILAYDKWIRTTKKK